MKYWIGGNRTRHYRDEKVSPKDFLKEQVGVSEILVEREAREYEFPHLSFQGYLAAIELHQTPKPTEILEHWGKTWWKETILLYTNQLSPVQFGEVIQEGYQLGKDAAELAAQCFREYQKPDKLDPAITDQFQHLKSKVQKSVFQTLEAHLKNGQWKQADEETYRLMITTVGKEPGQWFDPDELLNFPCDELLAIDALWVQYSQGKFGFSIQKDLYITCGGLLDGKYHKEAWNKFCQDNGWMKEDSYLGPRYDLEAPTGNLPFCRLGWRRGVVMEKGHVLFSRTETCKV